MISLICVQQNHISEGKQEMLYAEGPAVLSDTWDWLQGAEPSTRQLSDTDCQTQLFTEQSTLSS